MKTREKATGLSDGSNRIERRKKKTTNTELNKYFDKLLQRGQ